MGCAGSKTKTKDPDNEPYGTKATAASAAGGERWKKATPDAEELKPPPVEAEEALVTQQQQQQQPRASRRRSVEKKDEAKSDDSAQQVTQPAAVEVKTRKKSADEQENRKSQDGGSADKKQRSSGQRGSCSREQQPETVATVEADDRKSSKRTTDVKSPTRAAETKTDETPTGRGERSSGSRLKTADPSDINVTLTPEKPTTVAVTGARPPEVKPETVEAVQKVTPLAATHQRSSGSTKTADVGDGRAKSPVVEVSVAPRATPRTPVEPQTDIKSVNPDMQIFEALQKVKAKGDDSRPTSPRKGEVNAMVNGEASLSIERPKRVEPTPDKSNSVEPEVKVDAKKPEPKKSESVERRSVERAAAAAAVVTSPVSVTVKPGGVEPEVKKEVKTDRPTSQKAAEAEQKSVESAPVPSPRRTLSGGKADHTETGVQKQVDAAQVSPPVSKTQEKIDRTSPPKKPEEDNRKSSTVTPVSSPEVQKIAVTPTPEQQPSSPVASATATPPVTLTPAVSVLPTPTERRSIPRSVALQTPADGHKQVNGKLDEAGVKQDVKPTKRTLSRGGPSIDEEPAKPTSSRLPTKDAVSPTTPTPAAGSTVRQSSTVASPVATPSSAVPDGHPLDPGKDNIRNLLVDLSPENRTITVQHHLQQGTRVKVIQQIDTWLTGPDDGKNPSTDGSGSSRVLAVYGRPGSGKTCLAADACRRFAGARNLLIGAHFFHWRASGLDHNRAGSVVLSLAGRLADKLPGYLDALPGRAVVERLILDRDVSELFDALITQPLNSVKPPRPVADGTDTADSPRKLIVLDAIDEADPADRDLLFQLVNSFDLTAPDWLYLFVTLRGDNQLVDRLDRVGRIELKSELADPDSLVDVKRYLREPMGRRIDRISLDGALTQLAKNADGNFLCARLLKDRLESLPDGTSLALRDISLTFPTGLNDICRQAFQGLHDRLTKTIKTPSRGQSSKDPTIITPYSRAVSLLVGAVEPLPSTAFGPDFDGLFVQMNGTVTVSAEGLVSLAHRAVADWIVSEQTGAPLAVALSTVRQVMAEATMTWIGRMSGDEDESGGGAGDAEDVRLQTYALKHAIYHLTDAPKQHENVAKVLCSLRYVEQKLKVPGVRLDHLVMDYQHSHYQTTVGSSSSGKLVTLESVMKRIQGLSEQISMMETFVQRRGRQLTQLGPDFTLHVAANYPTVERIQDNARLDLANRPWLEDLTVVADTPRIVRQLRGSVVDVDVSADQRLIAVATRADGQQYSLLFILNVTTGEPTPADPIDLGSVLPSDDRGGPHSRFIPASSGALNVFVGSLRQFISSKTGKPVDTGLDVDSVKLTDRFSIECSAVSAGGLLALGVTTLPWGGRSLHAVLFDVGQTKKCTRTIELLKFRFGGSSQYGVKAIALSADGSVLCTCVKQSNRAEMKVTTWTTSKGDMVASTDVDDDTLSKCCVFGVDQRLCVLLGSSVRGGRSETGVRESIRSGVARPRRSKTFVWSFQESGSKALSVDRSNATGSLGHAAGPQVSVAQRRGSSAILTRWKVTQGGARFSPSQSPDKRCVLHGLDAATELVTTDKVVVFVTGNQLHLHNIQDLQSVDEQTTAKQFVVPDVCVEGLSFGPRTDDPVVAYRPFDADTPSGLSACLLSVRADGIVPGARLFSAADTTSTIPPPSSMFPERLFGAPDVCTYNADASCVILRAGDTVKVRDVGGAAGSLRSLPAYADVVGNGVGSKMADRDNNTSLVMCVVSSKDSVVGLVYGPQPHVIRLFEMKAASDARLIHELRVIDDPETGTVTDFGFLPHNGHVVSYYRKLDEGTLVVWNQKNGSAVHRDVGVDVGYVRFSPTSDRFVVSVRRGKEVAAGSDDAYVFLRNSDARFGVRLSTSVPWIPDVGSSDAEFSGDGTVLVGLCAGSCRVWNAGNGEPLRTFDAFASPVVDAAEIVGMPTNSHALFHDVAGRRLTVVDLTSGSVVAAVAVGARASAKWTSRRLRVSPRGGVVVGATEDEQLRMYACRNMQSVKRATTLQILKSPTTPSK